MTGTDSSPKGVQNGSDDVVVGFVTGTMVREGDVAGKE